MPEARVPTVRGGGGGGGAAELAGGFFIARVLSPGAVAAAAAGPRRARRHSATDNKENVPLTGSGRRRKSPLPSWYPRSPLRDITAVVNALERRRSRMRAARVHQRNIHPEESDQISVLATPLAQEQTTPLVQGCPSDDASDTNPSSTPTASITTKSSSPAPNQLQTSATTTLISPTLQSCDSANMKSTVLKPIEMLCSSMDEIEKVAKEYLKKTPKVSAKTTQRRALMSMR